MRLFRLQTPEGFGPYLGNPCSNCKGSCRVYEGDGSCKELHTEIEFIADNHFPAPAGQGHRFWFTERFVRKFAQNFASVLTHPKSRLKLYARSSETSWRIDSCQHTDIPPQDGEEVSGDILLPMFVEEA